MNIRTTSFSASTAGSPIVRSAVGMPLLALLLIGGTACDKVPASGANLDSPSTASNSNAAASADASQPGVVDPQDPCRLLEAREVEAVLGAKLAGAPFRAGAPNGDRAGLPEPGGPACWYETADFRNIAVQGTWTDAGAIMAGIGGYLAKAEDATKGLVKLQDGTELTGDWDEVRMLGCCNFMAMQGDSMVEIDFGGSGGSLATQEQAGTLANAALARMAAPLPIDGNAGIAAARQRQSLRPAGDACSLWNAEDIRAILGGELKDASGSPDECTWTYDGESGRGMVLIGTVEWRNGYRTYHEQNDMMGGMTSSLVGDAGGGLRLRKSVTVEGPWDAALDSPIQFNTVKNDVQIALRYGVLPIEQRRALLERAYARMGLDAGAAP